MRMICKCSNSHVHDNPNATFFDYTLPSCLTQLGGLGSAKDLGDVYGGMLGDGAWRLHGTHASAGRGCSTSRPDDGLHGDLRRGRVQQQKGRTAWPRRGLESRAERSGRRCRLSGARSLVRHGLAGYSKQRSSGPSGASAISRGLSRAKALWGRSSPNCSALVPIAPLIVAGSEAFCRTTSARSAMAIAHEKRRPPLIFL